MSRETLLYRPHDPRADANGMVAKHLATPRFLADAAPMVISDIEPYRPTAADKHSGQRPVIGGRRQHREFLRRNGYVEVGNERPASRREEMSTPDRVADIRRALGE